MLHVYNAFVHLPVASVFRCAKVWCDRGLWGMCFVLWFTVPVCRDYAVTFAYLNSYVSATHLALILGDETTETRTYFVLLPSTSCFRKYKDLPRTATMAVRLHNDEARVIQHMGIRHVIHRESVRFVYRVGVRICKDE